MPSSQHYEDKSVQTGTKHPGAVAGKNIASRLMQAQRHARNSFAALADEIAKRR